MWWCVDREERGAHCLELSDRTRDYQIVHGKIRLQNYTGIYQTSERLVKVKELMPHPRYDGVSSQHDATKNDIALVVLASDLPGPYTKTASKTPPHGTNITAVGFGLNSNFFYFDQENDQYAMGQPDRLYEVGLRVGTWGKYPCPRAYMGVLQADPDTELCVFGDMTDHGFKSICNGDSGGPLFNPDMETIGVTSWGPGYACRDMVEVFDVYTKVAPYYKFFIKPVLDKYD